MDLVEKKKGLMSAENLLCIVFYFIFRPSKHLVHRIFSPVSPLTNIWKGSDLKNCCFLLPELLLPFKAVCYSSISTETTTMQIDSSSQCTDFQKSEENDVNPKLRPSQFGSFWRDVFESTVKHRNGKCDLFMLASCGNVLVLLSHPHSLTSRNNPVRRCHTHRLSTRPPSLMGEVGQ